MEKQVFISYARSDGKGIAEELRSILERHVYTTFYDLSDIRAGEWLVQLKEGISKCRVFVPVLTKGYLSRLNQNGESVILTECQAALSENVAIIPFVGNDDGIVIPDFLSKFEFAGNADELLRLIFEVIPDALLEQAQNLSKNYVDAVRSREEAEKNGILGGSNKIDRTIIIGKDDKKSELRCGREHLQQTVDILMENRALCLTGDGGCGKSYMLQELFLNICQRVDYYAIYVKLADVFPASDEETDKKDGSNAILNYIET